MTRTNVSKLSKLSRLERSFVAETQGPPEIPPRVPAAVVGSIVLSVYVCVYYCRTYDKSLFIGKQRNRALGQILRKTQFLRYYSVREPN